jgi:hypothetical protein
LLKGRRQIEMAKRKKTKCRYCRELFIPDKRVGSRQEVCSSLECQRLRKKENNRIYRKNNLICWKDWYEYVKEWRGEHPDYQKQWRQRKKEQGGSKIQTEKLKLRDALNSMEKNLKVLRNIGVEIIHNPPNKK